MKTPHALFLLTALLWQGTASGQTLPLEHVIVASNGKVEIKHGAAGQYQPASFGDRLTDSDSIHLGDGASVQIVCADLTLAPEITQRYSAVPCRKDAPVILSRDGVLYGPVRSSNQPAGFPVVLGPRATRILDRNPSIAWTAVPGATAYRVSIQSTSWSTEVRGATQVSYPRNAPALVPDQVYRVTVVVTAPPELAGLSSDADSQADMGFSVLPDAEASAVRSAQDRIRTLATSEAAKRFLTALVYSSKKLRSEAIGILERMWSTFPEYAVAQETGGLYRAIGINTQASRWYSDAQKKAGSDEDRARALEGIAMSSFAERSKSNEAAKRALALFQKTGDDESAKRMQHLLDVIAH